MADVSISYKDATIAQMSVSGTKTLLTADNYCENNIVVEYTRPTASDLVSGTLSITENGTGIDVTNYASVDVNVSGGGGVETVNVDVFTVGGGTNCIYYTDANMTFQTNAAKMARVTASLPKGSILVANGYTTVRTAVGVTLVATIESSTNIYEVTG